MDPVSAVAVGTAASSATATTAAAASTAGLFGAAGQFSLMTTLSTLGTAFGVASTVGGAIAQGEISKQEQRQSDFNARQEEIRGKEEANAIKLDVARALANQNARGAASGIDISSSGSFVNAQKAQVADANRALSTAGTNAKLRAETERIRGKIAGNTRRNAIRSGFTKSASLLGDFGSDLQEKGFSF